MSVERLSGQGYAPIPQCVSNTDTEEEDEHLSAPIHNSLEDSDKIRDSNATHGNGWCHNPNDIRNYGKESMDCEGGYRYCGDEIPMMIPEVETQDDFWKRKDMSMLRRFCLILSILLCFVTLLVFLYVLPCDNSSICPQVVENQPVITWDKTLEGIEVHGPISMIHGNPVSWIFLVRGQRFGPTTPQPHWGQEISSVGGGVLSLQGNTGRPLWWIPSLEPLPTNIDCTTFTDASDAPNCIVIGKDILASINPMDGTIHWTSFLPQNGNLPLHIPDINSDGVDDMLIVRYGDSDTRSTAIVIMSGKDSKLLVEHPDGDCASDIKLNGFDTTDKIFYSCNSMIPPHPLISKHVDLRYLLKTSVLASGAQVWDGMKKSSALNKSLSNTPKWNDRFGNYTLTLTPNYQLNIQNLGSCPTESCRVNVSLTLKMNGSDSCVIWNHTSINAYAMKPAIYPLGDTPYTIGFAIKFWHWDDDKETSHHSEIVQRHLTERIQLVFVNYTNVHVTNASQSEVIQLCKKDDCQPNLELQTRSIAIANLGSEGAWELINYESTYNAERLLTSRVRVVKLDTMVSELANFTQFASTN